MTALARVRRLGLCALATGALAACQTGPLVAASPSLPAALARRAEGGALAPGRPARVVLVSVAGLDSAAVLGTGAGGAAGVAGVGTARPSLPVLRALARGGAAAEVVETVAPASAYPTHTTFVTGRRPASHGVPADRRLGRRAVRRATHSDAGRVRGSTLWQVASSDGVVVASLDWPATQGAAIPLLLPDVVPERRGETWQGLLGATTTPWLLRLVESRADPRAGAPGAARDALMVDLACEASASPTPPVLLLLRLSQVEAALRSAGGHGEAAHGALERVDRELGRLVDCLDAAGRFADGALVVVGDRALLPVHTAFYPNAVLAQAGLVGRGNWSAIARSNGGSAFVYAADAEDAVVARRLLGEEAERTGAFRVVSADEMIRLGADPDAWFGLEAEPGYVFGDTFEGPSLRAAAVRAAGGQLASAGSPAFVAYGRGVRPGLRVPRLRQIDVAPTLAALLGLPLPDADGRALVGLLSVPPKAPVGTGPPATP